MIVIKLHKGLVTGVYSDHSRDNVTVLDSDTDGIHPNDLEVIDGKLTYVYRMESKPLRDGKLPDAHIG